MSFIQVLVKLCVSVLLPGVNPRVGSPFTRVKGFFLYFKLTLENLLRSHQFW